MAFFVIPAITAVVAGLSILVQATVLPLLLFGIGVWVVVRSARRWASTREPSDRRSVSGGIVWAVAIYLGTAVALSVVVLAGLSVLARVSG